MTDKKTIAYKAFDKNMQCRGYQYEVGLTYTHDGTVEMCKSGFHACENPLDVLNYYPMIGSRFAEVECVGEVLRRDGEDSKVCVGAITIKAEVTFGNLIERAVAWIVSKANATSGYRSPSATSGNYSPSATSGDYSPSATSGNDSPSATSGYLSHSATSGNDSPSATSGNYSPSATSGDYSPSATSGNDSPSATSGYLSHSATSGNYSPSATSGNYSHSATSGYLSPSETSGGNSVAAAIGNGAKARAGKTGGIALAEYDDGGRLVAMFASLVGENGIEAGVWYRIEGGKPVACE